MNPESEHLGNLQAMERCTLIATLTLIILAVFCQLAREPEQVPEISSPEVSRPVMVGRVQWGKGVGDV